MPKKPAPTDWHRADIIAAVRKTDTTLYGLSRKLGYKRTTLSNALYVPAPKYERIIAEYLGLKPQTIWPSRYRADGTPKSRPGERGQHRYNQNKMHHNQRKFNASKKQRKVNLTVKT